MCEASRAVDLSSAAGHGVWRGLAEQQLAGLSDGRLPSVPHQRERKPKANGTVLKTKCGHDFSDMKITQLTCNC
eukprot:683036-Amphidinium_carterae.1